MHKELQRRKKIICFYLSGLLILSSLAVMPVNSSELNNFRIPLIRAVFLSSFTFTPGYLDLDVSPEDAKVYINGIFKGTCDQYDGIPDYLYLNPGTYSISFEKKGYLAYSRQITVQSDQEIEFNVRLQKDPSNSIEKEQPELLTFAPKNADDKIHSNEKVHKIETPKKIGDDAENTEMATKNENNDTRGTAYQTPLTFDSSVSNQLDDKKSDSIQGTVHFRVFPKIASLSIDEEFLSLAEELNNLKDGIKLSVGEHSLIIECPGYQRIQQIITVTEKEPVHIRVILSKLEEIGETETE